jgi:hypothetical protein
LHAIVASVFREQRPHSAPQQVVVQQVSVTRVTPTPRPKPTPHPTRAPIALRSPGEPARKDVEHRPGAARPKPPPFSPVKPIVAVPVGAQAAGSGNNAGAGSRGTSNSGGGAGGSGNGTATGAQPCGFVEFADPHGSQYDATTGGYWVDVQMTVHFPDRHTESLLLDYAWYYPNAAANPWSSQNLDDPNFPTKFQPPPPAKRAGEGPLVQYVIAHSTPDGRTLLKDCP